jgi:hypothetical protein
MEQTKLNAKEHASASLISSPGVSAGLSIHGQYVAECRDKDGNLKWSDTFDNHVATVGMDLMLDTTLDGTAYTTVGPYMGLISDVGWSTTAVGDTMGSHAGWTEAGSGNAPDYTGDRKTCVWSASSGGVLALSAALAFTFTGAGTVKGCFIVSGTGAVVTNDNTAGTLISSGVFTGGDKIVADTDVLNVSYSLTLADT